MFYLREAMYHETDQMGVIHHSNFIKWMEEARIFLFEKMGISYKSLEEENIYCPVTEVNVKYLKSVYFKNKVKITLEIEEYSGVQFLINYLMYNESDELVARARSYHCFLKNKKVISLKKENHPYHELLEKLSK
ncbi:acyl-CoA thioesterase [Acholeplasma sp. OttesenSCG-928-E16]|nr:acyl-CoA thioesterase [Acholeplasma sp. OttesenSCG-928-E16]